MTTYFIRTKLRILSVFMIAVLMLSLCTLSAVSYNADDTAQSETSEVLTHGAFEYTVDNDGAHITKFTGQAADVVVPSSLSGKDVVTIGLEAFWYCDFLTAVSLPGTVTCIEAKAFQGCKNLEIINIPDGVYEIGDAAFEGCEKLADIDLPSELLYVGGFAFDKTKWIGQYEGSTSIIFEGKHFYKYLGDAEIVNIPDGVISVSSNAFAYNQNITYVNIPDSVRFFGAYSFFNCPKLKSLSIGDDVAFIGDCAFGVDSIGKDGQPVYTEDFILYANDGTNGQEYSKVYSVERKTRNYNPTPDELPEAEKTVLDDTDPGYTVTPVKTEVENLGVFLAIIIVCVIIVGGLYTYFTIKEKKEKALKKEKKQAQNKNKAKKK